MTGSISESIKLHDPQAPFYRFRTPYLPAFFEKLTRNLSTNQSSKLMDLCCGNGELANGVVKFVDHVFAVDGSEEMLRFAKKHLHISYYQADVNLDMIKSPMLIDHILIGRAIHWIKPEALKKIVEDNLKKEGRIAICSSQWAGDNSWYPIYRQILEEYRNERKPPAHDFTGLNTLTQIGFKECTRFKISRLVQFDLMYLINHSISVSYGESLDKILKNLEKFRLDIKKNLTPLLNEKKLQAEITSWAIIYEKS